MSDDNPQGGENKAEALQKLLNKHNGDAMATLGVLFSENYDLREKNRKLKEQVPAEGAVMLSKADAERWEKFKALGKVEDVEKAVKETLPGLEAENKKLARSSSFLKLREAGYDPDAVKDFDDLEGKDIEAYAVKPEKDKDGNDVQVAYVTVGGKERPFEEYAKEKRPKMLATLKAGGEQAESGGTRVHGSSSTTGGPSEDVFTRTRKTVQEQQKQKAATAGVSLVDRFNGRTAAGQPQ